MSMALIRPFQKWGARNRLQWRGNFWCQVLPLSPLKGKEAIPDTFARPDAAGDATSGGSDAADSSTSPDVLTPVDSADVQDNPIDVAPGADSGPPKCGSAADCDDKNACTEDKCDVATGKCANPAQLEGILCDDFKACTTGEKCDGKGACVPKGQALWITNKIGATPLTDYLNGVAVGPDGTIFAVGHTETEKNVKWMGTLQRIGPDGTVKSVEKPTKVNETWDLSDVTVTASGHFVAVGAIQHLDACTAGMYGIQVNGNGQIINEFETNVMPCSGLCAAQAVAVAPRKAGGAVAVGMHKDEPGCGQGAWLGFLMEISASGGTTEFAKLYGGPFKNQIFTAVTEAPVGGGYWVGAEVGTNIAPGGQVVRLLRIQDNLAEISAQLLADFKPGKYQSVRKLLADSDGVTIFGGGDNLPTGYGESDAWVARVGNNNDKIQWQYTFGGVYGDGFNDAVLAPNGGYFVAGYSTLTGDKPATQNLIGLISPSGLLVWQKNIKDISTGFAAIAVTKTGVVVAGATSFQPTAGFDDNLLASCDFFGNCTCATSGDCIDKKQADCDDKKPCTQDICDAGDPPDCHHAIVGVMKNEGLTCGDKQTCVADTCLP